LSESPSDLGRATLSVLFLVGLTLASLWILRPFLAAFIWAVTIVVATWPLMRWVQRWLGGRRRPAVVVMTLFILLIFVMPIVLAISAIVEHAGDVATSLTALAQRHLPDAPVWLARIPLVGARAAAAWQRFAGSGLAELAALLAPYGRDLTRWLLAEAGAAGRLFIQALLIVILSAVLYARGEAWGAWMIAFGRRLAAERGEASIVLAGQAIRGVAFGVVVTAILQSALGGIGLAIAGVPLAALLTAIMLMLCIAQLGALFVLLPATAWLYLTGHTGWGTFLLAWSAVVGTMDNFVRPVLIKRGADLPLLLIFAGVIGGLLTFGLVGIFVGPVVLAVTYTLVDAWVSGRPLAAATTGESGK
jgi:predicted PurR-regulated permease PerM